MFVWMVFSRDFRDVHVRFRALALVRYDHVLVLFHVHAREFHAISKAKRQKNKRKLVLVLVLVFYWYKRDNDNLTQTYITLSS